VTGRPSNDCLAVERVDDLMESVVLRPRLTKRRDDAVFLAVSLTPGQTRGVDSSTTTPSDSIYIDLLISLYVQCYATIIVYTKRSTHYAACAHIVCCCCSCCTWQGGQLVVDTCHIGQSCHSSDVINHCVTPVHRVTSSPFVFSAHS